MAIKWDAQTADPLRMTNSAPPPAKRPSALPPRPRWHTPAWIAGTVAVFALLGIGGVAYHGDAGSNCIINTYGNTMCGDDAVSYCALIAGRQALSDNELVACEAAGWR